jgi:hypothetical protein
MSDEKRRRDLGVLVADKNMEFSMRGILQRPQALGITQISYDIYPHIERDPGCLQRGHDFLRPFVDEFRHALVILDHHGCGAEHLNREELEKDIELRLSSSGWGDRATAIVIDPELENWLWSDSPEVDAALGWKGKPNPLRNWIRDQGFFEKDSLKPLSPKEAVESALKKVYIPRSSAIYRQIAGNVSFKRCTDPAFLKLKEKLIQWFKAT